MQDGNNDLAITCNACGVKQSRDIEWLRENTLMACTACGNQIDLRREPWRGLIQRLWNASHHLGPPRRRLP